MLVKQNRDNFTRRRFCLCHPRSSLCASLSYIHYNDVKMSAMAFQITSLTIVYSTVYTGADQRKHQSSASLAFVRGIQRLPVNFTHKWPVTRKMFPFDDVIMLECDVCHSSDNKMVRSNWTEVNHAGLSRPKNYFIIWKWKMCYWDQLTINPVQDTICTGQ